MVNDGGRSDSDRYSGHSPRVPLQKSANCGCATDIVANPDFMTMPTLTREELYELVWSKPMTKVAAEYDITGTALKKTCSRHKIPTPERGHWAKLSYGKRVTQAPLPNLDDKRLSTIRIGGGYKAQFSEPVRRALSEARQRTSKDQEGDRKTSAGEPEPTSTVEPAILAATRRAMTKARADVEGFVSGGGKGILGFKIGPASIDRSLQILSRLFDKAQAQGFSPKNTDGGLVLIVDGEPIAFRLEEKPAETPHTPTPQELKRKADNEKWGYGSSTPWPKYDHSPSGRLSIVIQENAYSGLRRTYSDRQTRDLNSILSDVLIAMAEHAAYIKERRREADEKAREWRLEEARRQNEAAYAEREARREKFVEAIALQIERRERLLLVLRHLEGSPDEHKERVAAMIAWVQRRLKQIDSLTSPRFLDISARSAKIAFDEPEKDEPPDIERGYFSYASAVELKLWKIDEAEGLARSQSQLEWETEPTK